MEDLFADITAKIISKGLSNQVQGLEFVVQPILEVAVVGVITFLLYKFGKKNKNSIEKKLDEKFGELETRLKATNLTQKEIKSKLSEVSKELDNKEDKINTL